MTRVTPDPRIPPEPLLTPWRLLRDDRTFRRYWAARVVSLTGDVVTYVVLPVLVYRLSGSAFLTATATALGSLAYVAVGLVAGALTDRWSRRRVMVVADTACAVTVASIPAAGLLGHLTVVQVLAAAALAQVLFVFFDGANFGALPMLVGRDAVPAANTAVFSASSVTELAAPPLTGLALAVLAPQALLLLDAASFAVSAWLVAGIRRPLHDAARERPPLTVRSLGGDIGEGLGFLWRHPGVRAMTVIGTIGNVSACGILALLVPFSDQVLGIGTSGWRFGALFAAWGLGAIAGYLVYPRLLAGHTAERLVLLFQPVWVVFALLVTLSRTWWQAVPAILLWSAASTVAAVTAVSYRQMASPEPLLGRVSTAGRMITWGIGGTAGALLAGALATRVGVRPAGIAMACVAGLSVAYAWLGPGLRPAASVP